MGCDLLLAGEFGWGLATEGLGNAGYEKYAPDLPAFTSAKAVSGLVAFVPPTAVAVASKG
jgi:hypothetical protein